MLRCQIQRNSACCWHAQNGLGEAITTAGWLPPGYTGNVVLTDTDCASPFAEQEEVLQGYGIPLPNLSEPFGFVTGEHA